MYIPKDLHGLFIHQHSLVSSELPLQVLDVDKHNPIYADPHFWVPRTHRRALNNYFILSLPMVKLRSCRETFFTKNMLFLVKQNPVD
ncbi:hypothetical protein LguiB_002509 [Lonicera macranthoides]